MIDNELDIDGFLGHKTNTGGGATLTRWKDNDPPQIDTWLHRRASIVSLWRHRVPIVDTVKNFQTQEEEEKTISASLVCWENEKVLKLQHKKDDNGHRVAPPCDCGLCKFIDWTRLEVLEGRLDWLEPVFKLQGAADEKMTVVRATHIFNGFKNKLADYDDDEVKQLKAAKVMLKDAWSLNYFAKPFYVFRVVDNSHPEKGVQISIEPALLGDKVKGVIGDMREKYGVDDGNPLKKPYCIRWKHRKEEQEFNKKYAALAMDNIKLTPEIARLIGETDPPDISNITRRFNALSWKSKLQEQCLIDVPWDKLFGDSAYGEGYGNDPTDFDPAKLNQADKPAPKGRTPEVNTKQLPPVNKTALKAPPPPDDEDVEEVECDDCQAVMKVTDSKCPNCGKEYEVEAAPPPPPPPRRSRSEARAAAKAASAPATAPVRTGGAATPAKQSKPSTAAPRAKAHPETIDTEGTPVADDDIPF